MWKNAGLFVGFGHFGCGKLRKIEAEWRVLAGGLQGEDVEWSRNFIYVGGILQGAGQIKASPVQGEVARQLRDGGVVKI